ncbi:MAG: ABC transporter ATP-binding protein [Sediminibacterium sp.]|jgi:ABC-2 type transport system ATP-binding protein
MSLVVHQLSKTFNSSIAVEHLSFSINMGEVVGFLGPNGAGKSTTMKMIIGFLEADHGTITLNGITYKKDAVQYKKMIGYLPESNPLYEDMFVKEYLSFIAAGHEIKNSEQRIKEVIEQTGIGVMQNKKIHQLSKGYKQRLGLAAAIIHAPQLILLDEPTAGLDPNQLMEIRTLIKSLSAHAMILFSTHILQEVTAICDRVLVLSKGKLVADDTLATLSQKHEAGLEEIFKMLTH